VHEVLRLEADDHALNPNWAVFKLLYPRARDAYAKGMRELDVTSLDEGAVVKAYEGAARRSLESGREQPLG
jgi:hypothetical protein